ncbi:3'-5' exoribonuclease YhaM family protein [Ligilactobacillus sp. LYQ135]
MAKQIFDYKVDENMDLFALIKTADVRIAKNGSKFISFVFCDQSGEIAAKFWDASDQDIQNFTEGKVVHINGKRENYQNNPQIKIFNLHLPHEDEPNNPLDFIQKAPEDTKQMEKEFNEFFIQIQNPTWNKIVHYLIKKYHDSFFNFPAAKKNHHAFAGGLAYHTLSILRLAKTVANEYDIIDRSLLYAGAILHDLGKTIELSGPIATKYTLEGNLIGHIVLIDEQIVKACQELRIDEQAEDTILLRHMILAHHGLLEYGSPVQPHIVEAEVLHHLDDLDASIQMMKGALEHTENGEFSERIFGLDGRNFYKPEK